MIRYYFGPEANGRRFCLDSRGLWEGGREVEIEPTALKLLRAFVRRPQSLFTDAEIINIGTGRNNASVTTFVKDHVKKLRKYIDGAIHVRRGEGFSFDWLVETELDWEKLHDNASTVVAASRAALEKARAGSGERFYVQRSIEEDFARFVEGPWTAVAIVGESGMGKTTLAAHLAAQYSAQGHLCVLAFSSELSVDPETIERELVRKLVFDDPDPLDFWTAIDTECWKRKKKLLIFMDAVNEFNRHLSGVYPLPTNLMRRINFFVQRILDTRCRATKVILTCRPETWRRGTDLALTEFLRNESAYFGGTKGIRLGAFEEDESERAYQKYASQRHIRTDYKLLSRAAQYLLREPIFLDIATDAFSGRELPRELDAAEVFERYMKRPQLEGLGDYIPRLVREMFERDDNELLKQEIIEADAGLAKRDPDLARALGPKVDVDSPGHRLREAGILREANTDSQSGVDPKAHPWNEVPRFRFTHDRLAEYLISLEFAHLIEQSSGRKLAAIVRIIKKNLPGAQTKNVVFGALRLTLIDLNNRCKAAEFAEILRRIAVLDTRGESLVISVLSRVAELRDGLQTLRKLFNLLEPDADAETFRMIDAVYQILCDDEYRAWLRDHHSEQESHLSLLYGYFDWGLRHKNKHISDVAVQYLFFLWQGDNTMEHGVEATQRSMKMIGGLGPSLLRPERRRRMTNLTGLMILLLAEMPYGKRFDLAVRVTKDGLRPLGLADSSVLRLLGRLNKLMARYLIGVLKSLKNPIKYHALEAYYDNRDRNLRDYLLVSKFLMSDCDPADLETDAFRLALNTNSFVYQMLTFALSVAWERGAEWPSASKKSVLRIIEDLFATGEPVPEYVASIAIYQINYFGEHGNGQTMDLMKKMAARILSDRKGMRNLGGKEEENFNIIGTYGRSLHKKLPGSELEFVMEALNLARRTQDVRFYEYIAKNIGLLGVLIPPATVFPVITEILYDVGLLEQVGRIPTRFSTEFCDKARKLVLQSLANIRVLHRLETDRYLVDKQEASGATQLYDEVTHATKAEFQLATFHSWAIEQAMFRALTRYPEKIGTPVIKAFVVGAEKHSAEQCIHAMVKEVLRTIRELPV